LIHRSGHAHGHGTAPCPLSRGPCCAFTLATARTSRYSHGGEKRRGLSPFGAADSFAHGCKSRVRSTNHARFSAPLRWGARSVRRACGARPVATQNVGSIRHFKVHMCGFCLELLSLAYHENQPSSAALDSGDIWLARPPSSRHGEMSVQEDAAQVMQMGLEDRSEGQAIVPSATNADHAPRSPCTRPNWYW
jgi:hypothetical protein